MADEELADRPFFDLAPYCGLWPNASLATLSGAPSTPGPYETNLIRDIEIAWSTPLRQLTCEQVRQLLSQRLGLRWLAAPVIEFVRRCPAAEITNYPGEIALLSLQAAEDMKAAAPREFTAWLQSDFGWFEQVFGWDEELLARATNALQIARTTAGI